MRRLMFLVIFVFFLVLAPNAFAEGEFASSYQVNYEVKPNGTTEVTEDIILTNLTDRYYASNFNLTIGATKISDVSAFDSQGSLESTISKENNTSLIKVKFNQQVVGKDKTYNFGLKFNSKDFAEKQGQVWQVTIPKISTSALSDNYNLTLKVPEGFGDPTSIVPEPKSHINESGKLLYNFDKTQITSTGVLANFGTSQLYRYKLKYNLRNNNFLPSVAKLPLPPDTSYQQVLINNLNPKPDNVSVDNDGNYIAMYKVGSKSSLNVIAEGLAKLSIRPSSKEVLTKVQTDILTSSQKYWEKDNPIIKAKDSEIFNGNSVSTTKEKMGFINQFVVNYLKYNEARVKSGDFDRLGALTVLSNPDNALCGEFTDLVIALARAQNIPTRELIGYASSSNQDLRPLSFGDRPLHAWPEYYDQELGWVMIDPTWQNTSGGVDYFNKIDLNHFVLAIRGNSSTEPNPSNEVDVQFTSEVFKPDSKVLLNIDSANEIFSGFSSSINVGFENSGSQITDSDKLLISALKLKLTPKEVIVPKVPPFGHISYQFKVRSGNIFESYQDYIEVTFGNFTSKKQVQVKPFFAYKFFPFAAVIILVLLFVIYFLILHLHRTKFHMYSLPARKK